jgi:peptidoglycan/LPS O-acetylase OafA/YrhL
MHELFPIAGGLFIGALLPFVPSRLRIVVGLVAAAVVGVLATVVSGEYKIGWEFLAIDIPGAALATVAGYLAVKRARSTTRQRVGRF